jgi:hypothetical protein
LLAAPSLTLITFGKSALAGGFGAGFSAVGSAAAVSAFGGSGAGITFLAGVSGFSFLTGVTEAVFVGTVFLLQPIISIPENANATTNAFLIIWNILIQQTKNYADEFLPNLHQYRIKNWCKSRFTVPGFLLILNGAYHVRNKKNM